MAALRLIADEADDSISNGHHFRSSAGEDVDALVQPDAAVPKVVPAIAEVLSANAYDRHAQCGPVEGRKKRARPFREFLIAPARGRHARSDRRLACDFSAVVAIPITAELRDELTPVIVIG